jgi:hypothetical protein
VPKKIRDTESFRELGACLTLADEALASSYYQSVEMYGKTKEPSKRIEKIREQVIDLRLHMDATWVQDENDQHIPGPEPFYGNQYESLRKMLDMLIKELRDEADSRREDWRKNGWDEYFEKASPTNERDAGAGKERE